MKNKDTKVLFSCLLGTLIESTTGTKTPYYEDGREAYHNWRFLPGVLQFIREKVIDEGYKFCIVSNLPQINYGMIKPDEANRLGQEVLHNIGLYLANTPYNEEETVHSKEVFVGSGYYIADYENSPNAKPNPELVNRLAKKHGIDKSKSIMLGDGPTDQLLASRAKLGQYIHVGSIIDKYKGV